MDYEVNEMSYICDYCQQPSKPNEACNKVVTGIREIPNTQGKVRWEISEEKKQCPSCKVKAEAVVCQANNIPKSTGNNS